MACANLSQVQLLNLMSSASFRNRELDCCEVLSNLIDVSSQQLCELQERKNEEFELKFNQNGMLRDFLEQSSEAKNVYDDLLNYSQNLKEENAKLKSKLAEHENFLSLSESKRVTNMESFELLSMNFAKDNDDLRSANLSLCYSIEKLMKSSRAHESTQLKNLQLDEEMQQLKAKLEEKSQELEALKRDLNKRLERPTDANDNEQKSDRPCDEPEPEVQQELTEEAKPEEKCSSSTSQLSNLFETEVSSLFKRLSTEIKLATSSN